MPAERAIAESARQRAFRVPLDHYRQRDPLIGVKWWLSLAAIALTAGYVAWLFIDPRSGGRNASPGKLASAHASWNDDCRRCHVDFRPLSAGAVDLLALAGRSPPANHRQMVDRACIDCHAAQAAPHHTNLNADEIADCADCHQEHRGLSADIKRPADSHCTSCHGHIAAHRTGASVTAQPIGNVARFAATAHPGFRSLASDPGNIKFNHWLHLQPGLAVSDARQKLKPADLEAADRKAYQRFEAGGLLQLDCSACHESAAGGQLMRPIVYEEHCRACHPLNITISANGPPAAVPHGLSAQHLAEALDGILVAGSLSPPAAPAVPDESGAVPLVPGRTLGSNLAQKIGQDVARRRQLAALQIKAKCVQCHQVKPANLPGTDFDELRASAIPSRWLGHARFDHSAHRHVDCRTCHSAAFAKEKSETPDDEQVMIAGLATCVQCHAPASRGAGGARHDCAECHSYHSFPGSSLGTHHREAPASLGAPPVRPDSLIAPSTPFSLPSCSATSCHGDLRPDAPAWRSAAVTWLARDPHVQAVEVLDTFRAQEMIRLLAQRDSDPPASAVDVHRRISESCRGCHMSPSDNPLVSPWFIGLNCESCHGHSSGWRDSHYLAGFRRDSPGFVDTKDLAARAAVCMPCHVGPNIRNGQADVVDHDLIAAGHPRLTFEFRTCFESLPAHWDRRADEKRNGPAPQFQSWRIGQQAQARQRAELVRHYQTTNRGPLGDFALLDCMLCHHPQQPERADWPRKSLWPRSDVTETQPLIAAKALLAEFTTHRAGFDDAAQTYLALKALTADSPQPVPEAIRNSIDELGRFLGQDCYGPTVYGLTVPRPSQYDLPTAFSQAALAQRLAAVKQAIDSLPVPAP